MTSSVTKTCFDAIRAKQSAVVAGYDPIVVENQGVYEQLLLQAVESPLSEDEIEKDLIPKGKLRMRRQTPLVNTGYVSRVLSISYAIRSFVSYQKLMSSSRQQERLQCPTAPKLQIRIVLLGCGVDVIGLWARSLVQADDKTLAVTIIEVDKPDVCSIKRKMITERGMVKNLEENITNTSITKNKAATRYYTGNIVLPSLSTSNDNNDSSSDSCNDSCYDYVLIPGDLNDTSTLEPILLLSNGEQEEIPTLVVSELVLSYLPPSGQDGLLRWCSNRLCRTSDSAFVFLEPLGTSTKVKCTPTTSRPNAGNEGVITVKEGYQQDYCKKFHDKMERGRSSNTINNHTEILSPNGSFHPIGSTPEHISYRLREAGFAGVSSVTSLGVISSIASASVSSSKRKENDHKTLNCPEIFDEHAALVLHLQSYVLGCGLSVPQMQQRKHCIDLLLFRRLLCPWERRPNTRPDLALRRSGMPIFDTERGILYDEIESRDELSVRSLFQNTYGKEYTDKYPAIRKMVKGALNNDMRATRIESITMKCNNGKDDSQGPQNASYFSSSDIGDSYHSSGGIFLVATKYNMEPKCRIGENSDHLTQSKVRQVVGCVGIQSYELNDANSSRIYEIFRLAVDINHRGHGIGTNLLRAVEAYAQQRWENQQRRSLKFVANTLSILENATKLYEKCGYQIEKETPLGTKLIMKTYAKEVDLGQQRRKSSDLDK